MSKIDRYLHYGAMPDEMDGGAIVNYYQLREFNNQRPRDQHYVVPKVPEEFNPNALPFAEPVLLKDVPERAIPTYMLNKAIPVITTFHVGRETLDKLIEPVHMIGSKFVLWQTIHWEDDDIFKSKKLQEFDRIVAPTEWSKSVLVANGKLSHKQITVIPHGVPMDRFCKRQSFLREQFGIKENQKVFLYTGRLSLWKGIGEIIPIMRPLIRDYNCVFIIRGGAFQGLDKSREIDYILTTLSNRNKNIIYLPEWRPPEFMEELWRAADIFIGPSGHEGFFVPMIEGMGNRIPFITTHLDNLVENGGQNGLCGIYITPEKQVGTVNNGTPIKIPTADQLYTACKYLLDNPEESKLMGERGYQRCAKLFDLTKVVKQWFELYDNLLGEDYSQEKEIIKQLDEQGKVK